MYFVCCSPSICQDMVPQLPVAVPYWKYRSEKDEEGKRRNQKLFNICNYENNVHLICGQTKINGQTYVLVSLHDLPGGGEDDRSRVQVTDVATMGPHLTKGAQLTGNNTKLHGSPGLCLSIEDRACCLLVLICIPEQTRPNCFGPDCLYQYKWLYFSYGNMLLACIVRQYSRMFSFPLIYVLTNTADFLAKNYLPEDLLTTR